MNNTLIIIQKDIFISQNKYFLNCITFEVKILLYYLMTGIIFIFF